VAGVKKRVGGAKEGAVTAHRIGGHGRKRIIIIGRIPVHISRRAFIIRIEQEDLVAIGNTRAVPNVRDDQPALRGSKVDAHRAGGRIGGIEPHLHPESRKLPRSGIGPFPRRHRHDLHPHDHEAVIENPAHQHQEERQDDGELHVSLAFAPAPDRPKRLNIGEGLHCTFGLITSVE
jgi:hypothetical protein